MPDRHKILGVPTNVITGFLGVGKTTAILDLIRQKPDAERWAVLVNEFGEIGVDGRLFVGQASEDSGIYVEEVPGGCMCCASELPMQIALNRLLRRARPHRLLIEPTGLGHPQEVLQTLAKGHNREVLALRGTLTLVDARNLSDQRYVSHDTFIQQLEIADIVVANKSDLYSAADHEVLNAFVSERCHSGARLVVTEHGRLHLDELQPIPARTSSAEEASDDHGHGLGAGHDHEHSHADDRAATVLAADLPFPADGIVSAVNRGEGFSSIGWRLRADMVFDRTRLYSFLSGLEVERMKAVFMTNEGPYGYNMTRDALTEVRLVECTENRIEIIAREADPGWEAQLRACLEIL